jgi:hypothetical protein
MQNVRNYFKNDKYTIVTIVTIVLVFTLVIIFGSQYRWEMNIFPKINVTGNNHISDNKIKELIKLNTNSKINNIIITKENFEEYTKENKHTFYYFPNKCPNYTEDILLEYWASGDTKNVKKSYFVPQKYSLIMITDKHKWIKEPTFEYWSNVQDAQLKS